MDDRPRHTLTNSIGTEVGAVTADPRFNAGLVTDITTQTTDQPDNPQHYLFLCYALEQPCDPDELATPNPHERTIHRACNGSAPTTQQLYKPLHAPVVQEHNRVTVRTTYMRNDIALKTNDAHFATAQGIPPLNVSFPMVTVVPRNHAASGQNTHMPTTTTDAHGQGSPQEPHERPVNLTYAHAERRNAWNKIVPASKSTSTIAITANVSAPAQEDNIPTGAATLPTSTASAAAKSPTATMTLRISKHFASNFIPTITRTTSPSTSHPISSHGLLADLARAHKRNDKSILEGPTQAKLHGNTTPDPTRHVEPDLESWGLHGMTRHQCCPRFPGPLTVPVQHTSSPQMQDAHQFRPPTIHNTSLPHDPNVDYHFTYDPTLATPGMTAMFNSTAMTTCLLNSTPILTTSHSLTTWTAAMSIANEDTPTFGSMQCINVSNHHAQTLIHDFDTNYDHVTKEQAFRTNEARRGRMSRSRDMTQMKVGQQRHQLDLGKSAIEQLGDLIVTVLHKVYTALMCPRCSKVVEMGQILLEVNLDSPLNNAKKIMLWWPGSATMQVELISSTFDDPGIDYNELAGLDNVRTYHDIDPSPSLLPSGTMLNASVVSSLHLDCSTQWVKGDSSDLPLPHPRPMNRPACYPETVLWTLTHCKMDPNINSSAGNKSQPSMQRAIRHEDGSLISEEDWKAMHQLAILISRTRIEMLDITPYHKYLLEQVEKGATKKSGKSTSKKPMESTPQQLKLKKTFYRCFFFKEWFMALQELKSVAPLMSLCTGYWKADMMLGSVLPDTQFNLPTPASSHRASSCAATPSNASQAPRSQSSIPPRTHSQSSMPTPAPHSQSSMPPPTPQAPQPPSTPRAPPAKKAGTKAKHRHNPSPPLQSEKRLRNDDDGSGATLLKPDQQISHTTHAKSAMQAGDRMMDGEEDSVSNFSDTHPHSHHLNHHAHPWQPSTQDQQISHTTRTKLAMQAGNHTMDGEEDSVGNDQQTSCPICQVSNAGWAIAQWTGRRVVSAMRLPGSWGPHDLDQDNGNGNDEGDKHGNGESESDNGDDGDRDDDDDSLLATLKRDDLIAWVAAHDIKPQNKQVTKKVIMGAAKSEHPSKEDVQEIIESCQAKCNARTA
ncbi:hypothetical protein EDB83DRAFT_2320265 [Lactarius deliciosus]|nr:hypothetical protein EDB83DRAFT_2320265 [Lactarius deliciosus]